MRSMVEEGYPRRPRCVESPLHHPAAPAGPPPREREEFAQNANRRPGTWAGAAAHCPNRTVRRQTGCGTPEAAATSAAKSETSFSMPSPSWKRT